MAKRKKSKTEKLSLRERKLIKGLAQGLVPSEAARQAGYAESTINDHLNVITDKPKIKEAVSDLMDKLGLNDEELLKTLKEGLQANKPVSGSMVPADGSGTEATHPAAPPTVPDYAVRHKFLETALDLKGLTPPKKIDMNTTVETYEERLRRIHGNGKGGAGK